MTVEQSPVTILGDLIEQLESKIDQYEISTSEALARAYAAGAAADQVVPEPDDAAKETFSIAALRHRWRMRDQLLAIATELEAQ